ncbi:MAG: STAS domain-containing protein [Planctomycetota bacterium]|nr:STAS domain-containing protein [Planctomycetota bacterium]
MMDRLQLNREVRGEGDDAILVLSASGYIDASNVDDFETEVEQSIDDHSNPKIVVSLHGVEYINSSGLGVLISASQKLSGAGLFCLAEVPEKVARIIRLLGFGDVVDMYDSVDAATKFIAERETQSSEAEN